MLRVIMCCLLGVYTLPALAEAPEGYPFLSYDKAMQQAAAENKPVFVYFGRYGCGYCEKTNKEAFSDATVRERYTQHYVLAYVDSESGRRIRLPSGERITERELGTRYKAFVTPIFSFLDSQGALQLRLVGVQGKADLLKADATVQHKLGLQR